MSNPVDHHKVFIVIPAFNEQASLPSVIQELLAYRYSIVVVDDGSTDNLYRLINKTSVYFLRHKVNLGQGAALQTGIEFALSKGAEYLVTFDADGQHTAADIGRMIRLLSEGATDIVTGSRFMRGSVHNMPSKRVPLLQLARYLNYVFTGLLLTDAHNGLRAMTAHAASRIVLRENGMAHATEILSQIKKNKLRHKEIPVTIHYSEYSRGKGQTVWSGFRIFFDLLLNKLFR